MKTHHYFHSMETEVQKKKIILPGEDIQKILIFDGDGGGEGEGIRNVS